MKEDFINISQITKNYKDPASEIYFQALRGIDLTLREGTISSIIGPSGAGKSTLLTILGGMTKPSTGTIFVDGIPLHSLSEQYLDKYRREKIGFLWQHPERNLLPHLTAYQNIQYSMEVSNYPSGSRQGRITELLESVGLSNRSEHKLGQLSGGEAQRVSLAVSLANNPAILLADEPTGELDSETTMEIIEFLRQLNEEHGTTVVVVTHDNRFERMTRQSFNILDGVIAGLRRNIDTSKQLSKDWKSNKREEISVVNQFGMVKIPQRVLDKIQANKYIKFVEDGERMYIEAVKHE